MGDYETENYSPKYRKSWPGAMDPLQGRWGTYNQKPLLEKRTSWPPGFERMKLPGRRRAHEQLDRMMREYYVPREEYGELYNECWNLKLELRKAKLEIQRLQQAERGKLNPVIFQRFPDGWRQMSHSYASTGESVDLARTPTYAK